MRPPRSFLIGAVTVAALGLCACAGDTVETAGPDDARQSTAEPDVDANVELSLVGFAVPKAANNAIQAKFAATPHGRDVTWVESYGASGDQSRAVEAGLDADYVHFSLEGDVTRLVDAGLVADDWNAGPNRRHGVGLRRGVRRPPRQSEGDRVLGRPGRGRRRDRDTESRIVGFREMEHPRCIRSHHRERLVARQTPTRSYGDVREHRGTPRQR